MKSNDCNALNRKREDKMNVEEDEGKETRERGKEKTDQVKENFQNVKEKGGMWNRVEKQIER